MMKRILAGLVVILSLAAIGIVATQIILSRLIDRQRLIALVKAHMGDDLQFDGVRVSAFPQIGLTLKHVTLRDPDFAEGAPLAQVDSVRVAVDILPLLHHNLRIKRIDLENGQINMRRDASGKASWMLHPLHEARPDATDGHVASGQKQKYRVHLAGIRLRNVICSLDDQLTHRSGQVLIENATFDGLRSNAPAIEVHARHGETPFSLSGHVGSFADFENPRKPWHIGLGLILGSGDREDGWVIYSGALRDVTHLRGWSGEIKARMRRTQQLQAIFSHVRLPDIEGLSGRVVFSDHPLSEDPAHQDNDKRPWYQSLTLEMADLDIGYLHVPGFFEGRNISVSARNTRDALKFSIVIPSPGKDWAIQATVPTLSDLNDALHSRFKKTFPFSARLAPNTHRIAFFDRDGVIHVNGHVGRSEASFDMDGRAQFLPVGPILLEDAIFDARAEAHFGTSLDIKSLKLRSRALSLNGQGHVTLPPDATSRGKVEAQFDVTHVDFLNLKQVAPPPVIAPKPEARSETPHAPAVPPPADADATTEAAPPSDEAAIKSHWVQDSWRRLSDGVADKFDWSIIANGKNLKFGDQLYDAVKLSADYADQVWRLNLSENSAKTGVMVGSVVYKGGTSFPSLALHASPVTVPAELLLGALDMAPFLKGPVEIVGDLQGPATSRDAFQRHMTGHLGLSMVGGRIRTSPFRPYLKGGIGAFLDGSELPVRCFGLHINVAPTQLNVDLIGLDAAPVEVSGHGTFDRESEIVDFSIEPVISVAGAGASKRLRVQGLLENPHVTAAQGEDGRTGFTINEQKTDLCPAWLHTAREGRAGVNAAMVKKSKGAADLLKSLGLFR